MIENDKRHMDRSDGTLAPGGHWFCSYLALDVPLHTLHTHLPSLRATSSTSFFLIVPLLLTFPRPQTYFRSRLMVGGYDADLLGPNVTFHSASVVRDGLFYEQWKVKITGLQIASNITLCRDCMAVIDSATPGIRLPSFLYEALLSDICAIVGVKCR